MDFVIFLFCRNTARNAVRDKATAKAKAKGNTKMADIFDKIVGGLSNVGANLAAGSKEMEIKKNTMTIIDNLDAERKNLAEILGMKLYDAALINMNVLPDPTMANFISEISKRLQQIAEHKAALARLEEEIRLMSANTGAMTVFCTRCGSALAHGARFCSKCGNQQ